MLWTVIEAELVNIKNKHGKRVAYISICMAEYWKIQGDELQDLYSFRWNIKTSYYEQKTFWSLCSYMVRSCKGINYKTVKINDLCIGTENIFISPRLFFQDGRVPRRIFCEERIAIAFVIPGKPLSKKKIQY